MLNFSWWWIQTGTYDDKDNRRYKVVADNVQFLETKAQAEARKTSESYSNNNFGNSPYDYQDNSYQDNSNQGFNLGNADDAYVNMGDIVTLDDTDDID